LGGRDLAGRQWLRVAVACGVVGHNGFLVLDEPTAALDPVAAVDLVRGLMALGRDRTVVVVSHRLGVARMADRILFMDWGRVVEDGAHSALLAAGGLYTECAKRRPRGTDRWRTRRGREAGRRSLDSGCHRAGRIGNPRHGSAWAPLGAVKY